MSPLSIATPCLNIRTMKPADLSGFLKYRSDPEVVKFQSFDVMTEQLAVRFIEEMSRRSFGEPGEWLQLSIEEKISRRIVGDCAIQLSASDPRMAEIGITLSPEHRKKGFARETVLGLLEFLLTEKRLHRVYAITDMLNKSTIALMESIPMRKEAEFIDNVWFKGRWSSELQFAMLQREWDVLRP